MKEIPAVRVPVRTTVSMVGASITPGQEIVHFNVVYLVQCLSYLLE